MQTTSVISGEELQKLHSDWMKTEDIKAAGYSTEGEGWFDPMSLINVYKRGAVNEGNTEYVHGEVLDVEVEDKKITVAKILDKVGP